MFGQSRRKEEETERTNERKEKQTKRKHWNERKKYLPEEKTDSLPGLMIGSVSGGLVDWFDPGELCELKRDWIKLIDPADPGLIPESYPVDPCEKSC